MAAEASPAGFSSNLLVEELRLDMDRLLGELPPGEVVGLDFIATSPDGPSISYGIEVLQQAAEKENLDVGIYIPNGYGLYQRVTNVGDLREIRDGNGYATPSSESTLGLVGLLNHNPETTAFVPLLPAPDTTTDLMIREAIEPKKDVDGVSVNRLYTPATPEGMVSLANHILLNLPADHPLRLKYAKHYQGSTMGIQRLSNHEVWVFGFGNVVGRPLVDEVLPAHGIRPDPANVFKDRSDIEAGAECLAIDGVARVVFTAFGGEGGKLRRAGRGTILVDVGYALNPGTGRFSGNAHPDLVKLSGVDGRIITAFTGGGGPVTISIVIKRAIERKLALLRSETSRQQAAVLY